MKSYKSTIKRLFAVLLIVFFVGVSTISNAQNWPAGVHDPSSIIKDGDTYYVYATGAGVHALSSKDLVTWKSDSRLSPFTSTNYPEWINTRVPEFAGHFWAPDIIYMNGYYHLYYSCSEWGTMTSTIGCVRTKTLNPDSPDYKWEDLGFLGIWSYQPGLALNAIDAAMLRGPDKKVWMIYGSFNEEGIVITEIDTLTGKPYTYAGNLPGKSIANSWTGPSSWSYAEGEGGAMIYRDGYYYLFYNKGGCCSGIVSSYYMVMGRSKNPRGPFVDKGGKPMRVVGSPSGGTIVMKHDDSRGQDDRYYGPGHFGMFSENGTDYVSFHYYDPSGYYPNEEANNQGAPTLGIAKLDWGADGWPSISLDFVEEGIYTLENVNSGKVVDAFYQRPEDGFPIYQYDDKDTLTQKWIFNSLGTGEFTIQNYQEPSIYIESSSSSLSLTNKFHNEINQKFRTFSTPNGKTIIYPSITDEVIVTLNNSTKNSRLLLNRANSSDGQFWYPRKFDETLSVSEAGVVFDFSANSNNEVIVESNGLWEVSILEDSWLSVSPMKGNKTQTLTITATENPETSLRGNRIYITSYGGQEERLKVFQNGKTNAINQTEDRQVEIYPNPAKDMLTLNSKENSQLEIINQLGQRVHTQSLVKGSNQIKIKNYKQGVYIFKIGTKQNAINKRVLIN